MKQTSAGFTLLETLVALTLLGLIGVATLQLFSAAAGSADRVRAHTEAMALAQSEMERLLASDPAALPETAQGTFPPPFDHYRYSVTSRSVQGRNMIEVHLRVAGSHSGGGSGATVELATRRTLTPDRPGP